MGGCVIGNEYLFIDRFFESQFELLNVNEAHRRDVNTLYTFLNNLHSTADRLKSDFGVDIKKYPEFKLLRMIRNYLHHGGDVQEIRLKVLTKQNVMLSHSEHLIIPLAFFAKSLRSFIEKNKKNQKYIDEELSCISEIFSYIYDASTNLDVFCNKPQLKLDGVAHEMGLDLFKFAYNITNIIAEECRKIPALKNKAVIVELEETYSLKFNIPKRDELCLPNNIPLLTTQGFVYAKKVEPVA